MKKFFALFAAVLFAGSMFAQETVDFSAQGYENAQAIESYAGTTFSIAFDKGSNNNAPKYYNTGTAVRCYGGNTMTFAGIGGNLKSIVFTFSSGEGTNAIMADAGVFATDTWTGDAASVVFTIDGTTGHRRIKAVAVTIEGGELPVVTNYYVVGDHSDWQVETDYKMALNTAAEGEEYMFKMTIPGGAAFKVVGVAGNDTTWYPEGVDNNYVIPEGETKMYNIYFRPDGQGGEGWHYGYIFVEEYVAPEINSCASAVAALQAGEVDLEANYTIEGYVTSIATDYSDQYHNISFWMADEPNGGNVLEAFRAACDSAAAAPVVGDKVRVTGKLKMYNSTPEFAQGCTFEIIEHAAPVVNYFLVGTMNNWERVEAYMLAANPAAEGEYMLKNVVLPANSMMKVQGFDGENETWFPAGGEDKNFVINDSNAYNIYFRPDGQGGEGWHEGYIFAQVYEAPEINSCASAAEAALSVSENNELYNNGAVYTIEGFVTNIATAYSDQYHNITFWMADSLNGGKVLEAFRAACESEEAAPRVGDKVAVTGSLTKYNTTPEFAAGCTFEIIERGEIEPVEPQNLGAKTIAEFLELKNEVDTCILTGTVSNIVNTTYGNFDLTDETATVFVYGLLTPDGQSKQFENMGIVEGDVITVLALYNEYQGTPQVKNAILVSKAEGVNNVAAETKAVKMMVNGQLVIEKNGVRYNAVGQVVE